MKGIVHFLSGVALATFFPEAVQQAALQSSFVLVLGGVGGLLPDFLDFRLARFMEKPDVDIRPPPDRFDAQAIAEEVAAAVERVSETGQKLILQLRTMQLGADLWQQYSLRFDVIEKVIVVRLGPVVNMSQRFVREADDATPATGGLAEATGVEVLSQSKRIGRAPVKAQLWPTYAEETQIDIFGGPSFALECRNGQVEINFIPWHRQWSHSVTLAAAVGLMAALFFGPLAGAITALAYAAHLAEDQLGFLGSNLFWPLTSRRFDGLKLLHSGDPAPNFFAVWTLLLVIFFNLDRFAPQPLIDPLIYFGIAWLPALVLLLHYLYQRYRDNVTRRAPLLALQQADIVQETQEVVDA